MQPAARSALIQPFLVMEILARAQALEQEGRDIIHLEVGEPDFPTPPSVLAAASRCLGEGRVRYTPAAGLPELREAIAAFYRSRYGLALPPRRIIVTPGASGAFLLLFGLLLEAGDRIAMTAPGYPCYPNFVRLYGGIPVTVPVAADTDFHFSPELLATPLRRGLKGVIVASPANPTGSVLAPDRLAQLVNQVCGSAAFFLADEIYHGLEYGEASASALQFSETALVVNSFSKYFGMTGWRLGWAVVPDSWVAAAERLAQNIFIAASTPAQVAALAAFSPENLAELERRRQLLKERRDHLCRGLEALGFRVAAPPMGAFYVYAECAALTADSRRFAAEMLECTGVAVTPGHDFGGERPERFLRFSYTAPLPRLDEALRRIQSFLGDR